MITRETFKDAFINFLDDKGVQGRYFQYLEDQQGPVGRDFWTISLSHLGF